jgi:predicted nucleic acid-binding protein
VDLHLGYADAADAACAERNGGGVLTYDMRHVATVAREGKTRILGFEIG